MRIFSAHLLLLFFSLSSVQALALPFTFNPLTILRWDGLFRGWFRSPDFNDFWQDLGNKANTYKNKILNDAAAEYTLIADKINDFEKSMNQVVTNAETLAKMILKDVPNREELQNRFEVEGSRAWESLKEEFSEPLPEDQTERYKQQATRIARALDMTEDALVKVCGLPEADVRAEFDNIKPHISKTLLIMVNLVNNHPVLFETLFFSVVLSMIPLSLILRPIVSLFGFGPLGPVKGSFAAFAQRLFFGAAVTEASWFAMLQRAGMKIHEAGLTKLVRAIKCFLGWGC